jgi:hypothetical protein
MMRTAKPIVSAVVIAAVGVVSVVPSASAITADVARKCRDVAIKSHPPTTAGSKTGAAQAERDAYRACLAQNNDGKDEPAQPDQNK